MGGVSETLNCWSEGSNSEAPKDLRGPKSSGPLTLRAQRLKKINLAWNFQSRLRFSIPIEIFNPGLSELPTENRVLVGGSLEIFNLA